MIPREYMFMENAGKIIAIIRNVFSSMFWLVGGASNRLINNKNTLFGV